MRCNKCNEHNRCIDPCKDSAVPNCSCAVKLGSMCVYYEGDRLGNVDVIEGELLTDILKKINDLLGNITGKGHINIGLGAKIYRGESLLEEAEIRTLISSDNSIRIIEGENTIDLIADKQIEIISSDESVHISKTGETIDLTVDQKSEMVSSDNSIGVDVVEGVTDIKSNLQIISSDGSIQVNRTGNEVDVKVTEIVDTDIHRYIVNNRYTGSTETGSTSQPYKSIENALQAFQGTGSRDNPQNKGATIVIQKGRDYIFKGDFTYRDINIIIEEGARVIHQPTTPTWLVDLDQLTDMKSTTSIVIKSGALLRLHQRGFRNRGSLGGAAQVKTIEIEGTVELVGASQAGYVLLEANRENLEGYGMVAHQNFNIRRANLRADAKDLVHMGINTAIIIRDSTIRHANKGSAIDINSKAFYQTGGVLTLDKCILSINGVERIGCFILKKIENNESRIEMNGCSLEYPDKIHNLFLREGIYTSKSSSPRVDCQYLYTTPGLKVDYIFNTNSSTIWENIYFNYNIIKGGEISPNNAGTPIADLTNGNTSSVTNNIGGREIVTLTKYSSEATALSILGLGVMYILDQGGTQKISITG